MISFIIWTIRSSSIKSIEAITEIAVVFVFAIGTILFLISTTSESEKMKNIGAIGTYFLFIIRPFFCVSFWKKLSTTTIKVIVTKK